MALVASATFGQSCFWDAQAYLYEHKMSNLSAKFKVFTAMTYVHAIGCIRSLAAPHQVLLSSVEQLSRFLSLLETLTKFSFA